MKNGQSIESTTEVSSALVDDRFVVETQNLHKTYIMGDVEVHALRGVDLQIQHGEFVVIVGPSGCGKSTLLHLLGALDRPTEGKVYIYGEDLSHLSDNQLADIRLHKVGFVFQFFNLMNQLSAQANVELPLEFADISTDVIRKRSEELLTLVGLMDRKNHRPSELSGGEQQRIAIARALVNNPAILLADEPTGNLDSKTGAEIIQVLHDVNKIRGQTVIVVGHDERLTKGADHVIYLEDGKLVDEDLNNSGGSE